MASASADDRALPPMLIATPRRSSPRLPAVEHDHSPPPTIPLLPGEPFCLFIPRTNPHKRVAMPGYIITGAPGAGKTAVLRLLGINGHVVVEEAATDAIALDKASSTWSIVDHWWVW
jgi:hypothetical protein